MCCERCNGWMIQEQRQGNSTYDARVLGRAWRYVNCGNMVDSIIMHNRSTRAVPEAVVA